MLFISLSLAGSFALYGLVRKLAPVGSLPGLTTETLLLTIPAIGVLLFYGSGDAQLHFGHEWQNSLVLAGSGIATAVPLLLFATAARRMDYSALGFVQFLAPTIQFALSLAVFGEALRPIQLVAFVLIWSAIAVFTWDLLAKRSAAKAQHPLEPASADIRRVDKEPV